MITQEQKDKLLKDPRFKQLMKKKTIPGTTTPTITTDMIKKQIEARRQSKYGTTEEVSEERPGFFERVKEKFTGRTEKLGETLQTADPVTGALATTAAGVGTVFDVATEGAKSLFSFLTPDFIEKPVSDKLAQLGTKFAESEEGQTALKAIEGGMEMWGDFKEKHPTIATNVESVVTIGELFPAVKGAQITKKLVKEGVEIVGDRAKRLAVRRAERQAKELGETISPKLTAAEQRLATKEGRVIRGKENRILGKQPDTVLQSEKVKKAANTIQEEIPNAHKLNDVELNNQLKSKIKSTSEELKPQLKKVDIDKDEAKLIREEWENIKESQLTNPEFVAFRGSGQFQKNFEVFLDELTKPVKDNAGKFRVKSLDDVWNIRKKYDDSISKSVKQATDASAPSAQLQKEMWLENRNILNDVMEEMSVDLDLTSKEAFDKMSDLYLARQNIIGKTVVDIKGGSGLLSGKNFIKAAAGALGLKFFID